MCCLPMRKNDGLASPGFGCLNSQQMLAPVGTLLVDMFRVLFFFLGGGHCHLFCWLKDVEIAKDVCGC